MAALWASVMKRESFVKDASQWPLISLKLVDRDHVVHWKRPNEENARGMAIIEFRSHAQNPWLAIDCEELPKSGRGAKRTMITLSPTDGRALFEWLKAIYEPDTNAPDCGLREYLDKVTKP